MLDNPPFSILASIVDWYILHGIRFFLFAPQLTLFNYNTREEVTSIVCNARVTYANGAKVSTSFITNAYPEDVSFTVAGDLCKIIEEADRKALAEKKPKARPLLGYPAQVAVASILGKLATRGIEWKAPRSETMFARKLDCGKGLFGAGFLLSERRAAERLAAERRAAERLAAERLAAREIQVLPLSDREREIVASLSGE